ncbi:MAG: TonB family protein [Deltaproteobacteria bacterium]|nr:TonB family protein [Deltaproteobacteria bacterium]
MKQALKGMQVVLLPLLILSWCAASAAEPYEDADKTLSPYFFVKSEDPTLDQLPLKSTSVKVEVAGVIADVRVTQVYKNEGKRPLEAIYTFPASTRAAVYGMQMTIGERTIVARIQEREDARQAYEKAKSEGKSASLLEQQRPNVFQMNVANILPEDVIKVELSYTELLAPTDGLYEFVYPTVVGPRYSNLPASAAPPSEKWVENPYLREGEPPTYTFDIQVDVAAGIPIRDIGCNSHEILTKFHGPSRATVRLMENEGHGGNRDYILKYRLAGDQIESGLLLYRGEKENFFLLMAQPPNRVTEQEIPAREYIFVVDVSGSMRGFPLDTSKALLMDLIGRLRTVDHFNVLLFAGESSLMAEKSVPATAENIQRAMHLIDTQRGGGGTELLSALRRALALPREDKCSRSVIIATDGYVHVEKEAFDLIRNELGGANFFSFGIGTSVNRFLIEGMSRAGMGESFIVTKPGEAEAKAKQFVQYIQAPVLTDISIDYDGFEVGDVEPPAIPDVLAKRPVIVFGKWKGEPSGVIRLRGMAAGGPFEAAFDVAEIEPLDINAPLRYLWARHRIAVLGDYNIVAPDDERAKEITRLGLEYNLLTAYTSFVAIDTLARREDGQVTTVKQPLPLPQGVSDYAIGSGAFGAAQMRMTSPSPAAPTASPTGYPSYQNAKAEESAPAVRVQEAPTGIEVKGDLTVEAVRRVVQDRFTDMERCYLEGSKRRSGLRGTVKVAFIIGPDGRIEKAWIASGLEDADFDKCIKDLVSRLLFPKPKDGKNVSVVYPVTFETLR